MMRALAMIVVITGVLSALGIVAAADKGAGAPPGLDAQPVRDEAVAAMQKEWQSAVATNAVYPRAGERTWPAGDIPADVRAAAATWTAKVLKKEFVAQGIEKKFVGCRRTWAAMSREVDYLFARYEQAGVFVQVCDHSLGMAVLVQPLGNRPDKPPQTWSMAQRYVLDVFTKFFQESQVAPNYVETALLCRATKAGLPVFFGALRIDPNPPPPATDPVTQKRYWYDDMSVLVDGYTVCFFFKKLDGEVAAAARAEYSGKRW